MDKSKYRKAQKEGGKSATHKKKKRTMMIQSKNVPSNGRIEGKTKKD